MFFFAAGYRKKSHGACYPTVCFLFFCWLFYPKALQENIDKEAEVLDPGGIGGTPMESKWDKFVLHEGMNDFLGVELKVILWFPSKQQAEMGLAAKV